MFSTSSESHSLKTSISSSSSFSCSVHHLTRFAITHPNTLLLINSQQHAKRKWVFSFLSAFFCIGNMDSMCISWHVHQFTIIMRFHFKHLSHKRYHSALHFLTRPSDVHCFYPINHWCLLSNLYHCLPYILYLSLSIYNIIHQLILLLFSFFIP